MAKTVTVTIVVPDETDDATVKDFAADLDERFLDDSSATGFPAWRILDTNVRPATAKEAAAANLEDDDEDENDDEG